MKAGLSAHYLATADRQSFANKNFEHHTASKTHQQRLSASKQ
jgi:hypothetical protein